MDQRIKKTKLMYGTIKCVLLVLESIYNSKIKPFRHVLKSKFVISELLTMIHFLIVARQNGKKKRDLEIKGK